MNRMCLIASAAMAIAVSSAQTAFAADVPVADPMATTYGNTINLVVLPFWSAKQYFEPDHTWRQVDNSGVTVSGVWKIENGESCTIQTKPPGPTYCNAYVPRKVGDVWTNYDPKFDSTTMISLEKGRE